MSRRLAGRLDRIGAKLGAVARPRLVIVFEEVDARGRPYGPDAVEEVEERPNGITLVRRHAPHVVVIRERPDGPQ